MDELSDADFEGAVGRGMALVDFCAEWCSPCKTIHSILERIIGSYNGSMSFYTVDIDKAPSISARNGVMSVPTLVFFRDGLAVDRIVGAVNEKEIRSRIEKMIGTA